MYAILLLPVFFICSYFLITPYSDGDQAHYREFYSALENTAPDNVMSLARKKVSSVEPLSAYLLWVGSRLSIDKDVYISLLNTLLLLGIFLLGRIYGVGFIPLFLLLTNFYVIVLLTGAERLKVVYVLLVWAAFFAGNRGRILVGFSPLAHLSSFIMFPSLLLANHSESIRRLLTAGKLNVQFIAAVLIVTMFSLVLFGFLNEGITKKAIAYISAGPSWTETWKLVVLSILAILVTRDRWRITLVLMPMFPAVYLLGGIRVNMIAVTLVIYFLMKERVLNHPCVILLLVYFSLKSIPFVYNIYIYGNGFFNSYIA
jgi:hypothetical protein